MIIRWRPIHTSTELPVLLLGGPRPAAAAVLGRRLQDVLGELVQTTAGKWITPPTDPMPERYVATFRGRQRLSGRSLSSQR